jgi:hypothetical protein
MAAYMDGRHEGAAPAEKPDSPEAAFRAPLPALDRPSLGAARTLLQRGDGVGRFVADVIKTEADGTALP